MVEPVNKGRRKYPWRQDPNNLPGSRTTPEHKITKIYAQDGLVIISGTRDGSEVEERITRSEAISRARAANEMISHLKYKDEVQKLQLIVEQLIQAIDLARKQSGKTYRSKQISMAVTVMDPRKPIGDAKLSGIPSVAPKEVKSGENPVKPTVITP
jgi:hypothetical protein